MQEKNTKYLFVFGGVASGIGVMIYSIGQILQQMGVNLSIIKIDPYLNIDAGTLSPYEHGEVYVLQDGSEVDLDLGNYERNLNVKLNFNNSITSGKVFLKVLEKERQGLYLGKTVGLIGGVTNEIISQIEQVSEENPNCELILIEIGGTVGDYESDVYFESLREMILKYGKDNIISIMVNYVPYLQSEEFKSKPCQNAIQQARQKGISPDIIILRSQYQIDQQTINKIGFYSNLKNDFIFNIPDTNILQEVPLILNQKKIGQQIMNQLNLKYEEKPILIYQEKLVNYLLKPKPELQMNIVGKYVQFKDAYRSLIKALNEASFCQEVNFKINWVDSQILENKEHPDYEKQWNFIKQGHSTVIPGGYGIRGIEGKILCAQYCRENNIPTLGICFGFQVMVIEFCRNVLNIKNAFSKEFDQDVENLDKVNVIDLVDESSEQQLGGTMRRGIKDIFLKKDSKIHQIYKKDVIHQVFRHRYELNTKYKQQLEENGLIFTGLDDTQKRNGVCEYNKNFFYIGVQYHPEFRSYNGQPNEIFLALLQRTFSFNKEQIYFKQ